MNMLSEQITDDMLLAQIWDLLDKRSDFIENPIEGGFVSSDGKVIFYVDRFPYNGGLYPMSQEAETTSQKWVDIVNAIIEEARNLV